MTQPLTSVEREQRKAERKEQRIAERNRMDFSETGVRLDTENNEEILSNESTSKGLSRAEVMQLLAGYRPFSKAELRSYNVSSKSPWFRAIRFNSRTKRLKSFIRGGFLIHKEDEFVVLLNQSLGYTFSLPIKEIELFVKVPNEELVNPEIEDFVANYGQVERQQRPNVLLTQDLQEVHYFDNFVKLTQHDGVSKRSVEKKLYSRKEASNKLSSRSNGKKYYLLVVNDSEKDQFKDELTALKTLPLQVNSHSRENETIVRKYYR